MALIETVIKPGRTSRFKLDIAIKLRTIIKQNTV